MRLLGKSTFLGFEAATQQIFTAKHESHGTIGQQAIPPCPELQVTYNGGSRRRIALLPQKKKTNPIPRAGGVDSAPALIGGLQKDQTLHFALVALK